MQETLIEIINAYGYIGIAFLILIENVFPPIPSEVVLLFGGFMTLKTDMNVWLVILYATLGSVLGAAVLYIVGRILKKERLMRFCAGKLGRALRLKPEYIEKADGWFARCGYMAVLICRCVPIVRSLISIPAGMSEMKPLPFFALTVLGTAVWNTVLVWTGAAAGEAWEKCLEVFDSYTLIVGGVLAAVVVAAVVVIVRKRKAGKTADSE